jgi:orotidine-5'-phosphate decarboxylase
LGEARNVVNVLTSQVILVCGMSAGTASEVALALKTQRPVILVAAERATAAFFASLGRPVLEAQDANEAIRIVEELLQEA